MKTVLCLGALVAAFANLSLMADPAGAQPPRALNADIDYQASGFVMPAGAPGFAQGHAVQRGSVQQASIPSHAMLATRHSPTQFAPDGYSQPDPSGAAPTGPAPGGVAQVGFLSGGSACSSGCCDSGCCGSGTSGCDSAGYGSAGMGFMPRYASGGAYQACDPILSGGLLGKMYGDECGCGMGGGCGCGPGGDQALSGRRHLCLFCRGQGCSACQRFNPGAALLGALASLKPHAEGGLCAQRWYDFSAEGLFLGRTTSGSVPGVITQLGAGAGGTPVLFGNDAEDGDLESGIRLSGALIFGAGGNLEATYMGGHEWKSSMTASSPATLVANPNFGSVDPLLTDAERDNPFIITAGADLFSFISNFGTEPAGGFDDTDRSISQTVESQARFHSGEANYRRRTVGPYCRFQGSWLFGMRYFRYDNRMGLNMLGLNDDGIGEQFTDGTQRFFNASNSVKNNLFGAQIGGDLWWNVIPGVSFGIDGKLAWLKNEARVKNTIAANSINGLGGAGVISESYREDDGTLAMEFQTKMVYRLSHSWTFRSAYYLMAIDEVGTAGLNGQQIRNLAQQNSSDRLIDFNSLVLNGFSFGAEYTW